MSRVRAPDGAPAYRGYWTTDSPCTFKRLVGQAVKTPASHAGNAGSIPARVTIKELTIDNGQLIINVLSIVSVDGKICFLQKC